MPNDVSEVVGNGKIHRSFVNRLETVCNYENIMKCLYVVVPVCSFVGDLISLKINILEIKQFFKFLKEPEKLRPAI